MNEIIIINDEEYIFSGLTITLNYSDFISHFDFPYEHTILNNDVFTFPHSLCFFNSNI